MNYFVCSQYCTRYVLINFYTGAVAYTECYNSALRLAREFGGVIVKRGLEPFVTASILQCRSLWNNSQ